MRNKKNGETLRNNKKHTCKTNSVGFCFLDMEDFDPKEALHFLSGVVSFDVCAVFETDKELNKTYGEYAEPIKPTGSLAEDMFNLIINFSNTFTATEYCTTEYNNKDFKLIKYIENLWEQWQPREIQTELKWKDNI